MADAAVSFVVESLGELLIEKASSLSSVSKNVERLKRELIHMQGFLKAADALPHRNDEVLQNLVAEIRELAHDAEDIIASHAFAAKKCMLSRMINSWSVASEIDEFTSKITDLGGRLQRYGNGIITREAGEYRSGTTQQNLLRPIRRTYTHKAEQHDVIGLEKDAETIATKLIDGTHRTVSICGMGGIGKTTLAKKVYRNTEVGRHFDNRLAWGSVSQQHKEREIWLNILTKLASPDESERRLFSALTDDEIAKKLYQMLEKEKCLVVLDDIWTKEAWDCLRAGFPEANNTESKILLTTRNREVALHVDPKCFIHSPRCLNESQSWELFLNVAIRHREESGFIFDENLEELGRKIVNRCGGLPLAIKTIGGNLQTKSSIDEWTMVYNNMVSHLRGVDNGVTELGIMSLLALGYHDLPYQLKQCFLHFSHFPEDFIIPVDSIINIWVAQGIILKGSIVEEPVIEVEDIAYAYLEGLVSRCMIQVEKWSSTGKIKSCRLHDLMRDLCIQEAEKKNFVHAKYPQSGHDEATIQSSTSIGKFRHLALYMKNSNQGHHLNYDVYDHVRSLLVFCNNMDLVFLNKVLLVAMTGHFKYLRLLYLDGGNLNPKMPKEIGYLVHLRLFDMGTMHTKHLPSSLGKLTQLLTLKLGSLLNVEHMPNIFENMHQLRHLYLPPLSKFSMGNMKLSQLRNLQTLVNLPLKYVKIEDLVGLPSLRKLKLKVSKKDEFERLVEMCNTSPNTTFKKLRSLSVGPSRYVEDGIEITKVAAICPHLHKLKILGPLVLDLPESSQIFHNLNKLTLEFSKFVEDPMPHLAKLPSLRVLHLKSALGINKIMFPKNSFPGLQSLVLKGEWDLEEWIVEEGALARLGFLQLHSCHNLKTLPEGLSFIDSFQELQIEAMPTEFTKWIVDSNFANIVQLRGGNDISARYHQYRQYYQQFHRYQTYFKAEPTDDPNKCTIV